MACSLLLAQLPVRCMSVAREMLACQEMHSTQATNYDAFLLKLSSWQFTPLLDLLLISSPMQLPSPELASHVSTPSPLSRIRKDLSVS